MSRKNQGYGVNVNNNGNYNQNQIRSSNHIHHNNNRNNNSNSNFQNQRNNFNNHSRNHNSNARNSSKKNSANSTQQISTDYLKSHSPPKLPQAPFGSARSRKIGRGEYEELSKDEVQYRNRHDTAQRALKKFQVAPPSEMLNTHNRMNLGFPGFYPNTLEQPEEKTTVEGIQKGWADSLLVPHEDNTFKKESIAFFTPKILNQLNKMISNTLYNQRSTSNISEWSTPEIRNRPMTETQKDQWLVNMVTRSNFNKYDLFVPTDIKTNKILDYLIEHLVPLKKSLWLIRLVGLASIQNTSIPTPKYTHDWTTNFTQYLQVRIGQLLNPPLNSSRTPDQASVLRQQWDYCVDLSKSLYVDNILDQKIFLKWVMDSILKVSSNYVICLLPIAISLLNEFGCTRALSRLLIPVLLSHIEMIENSENTTQHQQTLKIFCQTMLQSLFCTQPSFFFHVKPWQQNENKYYAYITRFDNAQNNVLIRYNLQIPSNSYRENLFSSISSRNSRLKTSPSSESNTQNLYKVSDQVLEELFNGPISLSKDLSEIASYYFRSDSTSELKNKIKKFCFTCMYNTHYSDIYLFYLIPSIIKSWKDNSDSQQEKITKVNIIHETLFDFLEESLVDESSFNKKFVNYLYCQFIRENIFDLAWYIKKLISIGELGVWNINGKAPSKHIFYLRSFPGYNLTDSDKLIRQSKVYSGEKQLLIEEQQNIEKVMSFIKLDLKILFSDSFSGMTRPLIETSETETANTSECMKNREFLQSLSPYCASEISMQLIKITRNFVVKDVKVGVDNWKVMARPGTSLLNLHQFSIVAYILETLKEVGLLIELCIWLLSNTFEKDLESFLIVLLNRYRQYFISMNITNKIVTAMVQKYDQYKPKGIIYKPILSFLQDLQKMGFEFEETVKTMINSDLHQVLEMASTLKSFPKGRGPSLSQLPELYTITNDPSATSLVSDSLVYRFNDNPALWSNVLHASAEVITTQANSLPPSQSLHLVRSHINLLWELSLHTYPEGFLLEWVELICDQYISTTSQWSFVLVALLATRGACRLEKILQRIFNKFSTLVKSFLKTEVVQLSPTDTKALENLHFFINLLLIHQSFEPIGSINVVLGDEELYSLSAVRDWAFQKVESLDLPLSLLMYSIIIHEKLNPANPVSSLYKTLSHDIIQAPWFSEICHQYPSQIDKKFTFGGFRPLIEREQISINSKISSAFSRFISNIFGLPNLESKDMLGQISSLIAVSNDSATSPTICDNLIFRAVNCLKEYFTSILPQINESSAKGLEFEKFMDCFFDEWVVDDRFSLQFLTQVARDMPQECVLSFLYKGLQKLNCPSIKTFPENVMIYSGLPSTKHIETLSKFQSIMSTLFRRTTESSSSDEVLFVAAKQFSEQLGKFLDYSKVIEVMQTACCSFNLASQALNSSDKQINRALKWIHNSIQDTQLQQDSSSFNDQLDVNINTLRGCALIRFQLQASVLPHLLSQTHYPRCEEALENMMILLLNPLVHSNGTQDDFFTHILDSVSLVLDEVSNKNKSNLFSLLRNIQRDMVLPICVASRIKSLFPFESRNTFTQYLDPPSIHNKINVWEWGESLGLSNPPENLAHFKAKLLPLTKSTTIFSSSNARNFPTQGSLLNRNQFLSPPAMSQPQRPMNAHNRPSNYHHNAFHQQQMANPNRGHHQGPRPLLYNSSHTIKAWMHTTDPASLQLGRNFAPGRAPNSNGGNFAHGDRSDHPHPANKNPTPSESTHPINVPSGNYTKSNPMQKGVSKR